jgi:hypothetical protein
MNRHNNLGSIILLTAAGNTGISANDLNDSNGLGGNSNVNNGIDGGGINDGITSNQ